MSAHSYFGTGTTAGSKHTPIREERSKYNIFSNYNTYYVVYVYGVRNVKKSSKYF